MIIDCDDCALQHTSACSDCVVTVLLHQAGDPVVLNTDEQHALGRLSEAGLVAPLRLVPGSRGDGDEAAAG